MPLNINENPAARPDFSRSSTLVDVNHQVPAGKDVVVKCDFWYSPVKELQGQPVDIGYTRSIQSKPRRNSESRSLEQAKKRAMDALAPGLQKYARASQKGAKGNKSDAKNFKVVIDGQEYEMPDPGPLQERKWYNPFGR